MKTMRTNRIGSLALIGLAALLLLGQSASAGAQTGSQRPTDPQYFQDVAPGSFWYNFTTTLYLAGITSGYPCGTPPAGACVPPANLPYYQPNDNITRGQMAKFMDLSLGNFPAVTTHTLTIQTTYNGQVFNNGALNVTNNNPTATNTSAIFASGPTGVWGVANNSGSNSGTAGLFTNYGGGSGVQYGVNAQVTSSSSANINAGGVFTDNQTDGAGAVGYGGPYGSDLVPAASGLAGYSTASGIGVYGQNPAHLGIGTFGDAENYPNGNGDPSAVGGHFRSYDGNAGNLGLQVDGQGHATGGFSTGLAYYMTVKYNGSDALHPGDILALDGNNATINGTQVLGTVKANAANAGAAVGVIQYRLQVYEGQTNTGFNHIEQTDAAGAIKPGDLVQIVIVGQAQVKVSGSVSIGDRLAITSDGNLSVVKAATSANNTIGKVASQPDKNGYVTVFVNLK